MEKSSLTSPEQCLSLAAWSKDRGGVPVKMELRSLAGMVPYLDRPTAVFDADTAEQSRPGGARVVALGSRCRARLGIAPP